VARIGLGGLRGRLSLAVVLVVALALAAMAAIFNVVLDNRLSADANSVLRSRATDELAALTIVDGKLHVRERPEDAALETRLWVFAGRSQVEGPARSPAAVQRAVVRLVGGASRRVELTAPDMRLLAVPVELRGARLGTVVAAISMEPYEQTRRTALIASLILCAGVLAVVLFMARWAVARALRPVSHMTAQAAKWSEADLDRRFSLGDPRDELTQLAATLDGLLERQSAAMRHEQRFSAEISHELRTPLAKIRAEAEIALRRRRTPAAYRDALATVLSSAERMSAVVDTLLVRAAAVAADTCRELSAQRGVTLTVNGSDDPIKVAADEDVVERILFPLIENGCRYASGAVRVDVEEDGRHAVIHVVDDGPGVTPDEIRRIFQPGERGQAAGDGSPGAGLGLALARRLARQVGGEVMAEAAPGGRFTVQLPRSD